MDQACQFSSFLCIIRSMNTDTDMYKDRIETCEAGTDMYDMMDPISQNPVPLEA